MSIFFTLEPAGSVLTIKVSFWQSRMQRAELRLHSVNCGSSSEITLHINVGDEVKSERQAVMFCSAIRMWLVYMQLNIFLCLTIIVAQWEI